MSADDLDDCTLWDDCREPGSQFPDRDSVPFDDPTWERFDSEEGGGLVCVLRRNSSATTTMTVKREELEIGRPTHAGKRTAVKSPPVAGPQPAGQPELSAAAESSSASNLSAGSQPGLNAAVGSSQPRVPAWWSRSRRSVSLVRMRQSWRL